MTLLIHSTVLAGLAPAGLGVPGPALPQTFRTESYTFDIGRPRALCAADLDQDGALDVAAALWDADAVAVLMGVCATKP